MVYTIYDNDFIIKAKINTILKIIDKFRNMFFPISIILLY